jgi:hypothetical protein
MPAHHVLPCPGCGSKLEIGFDAWGNKAICPSCECKFVVASPPRILSPPRTEMSAVTQMIEARVVDMDAPPRQRAPEPAEPVTAEPLSDRRLIAAGGAVLAVLLGAVLLFAAARNRVPRPAVAAPPLTPVAAPAPAEGMVTGGYMTVSMPGPLGDELSTYIWTGDFLGLREGLATNLLPLFADAVALAGSPLDDLSVQAGLAQHELVRCCGIDALAGVAGREGGAAFLTAFLGNPEWIESFLVSGPPAESHACALENLRVLYRNGEDVTRPVYRRLATAIALQGGKMLPYRLVDRFRHTQQAHRDLLLHASFDTLDVREMRWTLSLGTSARDYQYLLDDRQVTIGDCPGACWACWYLGDNAYGDTVQGPLYYRPWSHVYTFPELARNVGGVCGSLSTFGSLVARAHGIPSTPAPQPGHCAYVVRSGADWVVGYNVAWPTSFAVPGWDGTGYATANELYEPVYKDQAKLLGASRLLWAARMRLEQPGPRLDFGDWTTTYERALDAQPLNYGIWLDYMKTLESATNVPPSAWKDLGRRAGMTFTGYPEAGWALVRRAFDRAKVFMTPDERLDFLTYRHEDLRQKVAPRFEAFPFAAVLNWQADGLADPDLVVRFFSRILRVHAAKAPNDWMFSQVLNWGRDRLAGSPSHRLAFAQAVQSYFREAGEGVKDDLQNEQIRAGIRAAGDKGDLEAFQLWCDMAEQFLPAFQPSDVFLNPAQAKAFPARPSLFGELLSYHATLATSAPSQFDRPLSYRRLLRETPFGGYFDTGAQDNPWAIVQLQGDSELSGIVVVNRYEAPAELSWAVPLKISVSTDGKSWTQVALFESAAPVYTVSLAERVPRARFVRVERTSGKAGERFHLRNILVYGRQLY